MERLACKAFPVKAVPLLSSSRGKAVDWKRIGKKILFPPIWLMVVLVIISAVALIFVFAEKMEQSIPAYIAYVLAFYTLSVVTVFVPWCFRSSVVQSS